MQSFNKWGEKTPLELLLAVRNQQWLEGGREATRPPPSHLGSQAWGGAVGRRQGRAQDLGSGYSKFQVLAKIFFDSSKYTHALIEY